MHSLKELRKNKGLSLEQLKELSGFGVSTINNFENGRTQASAAFIKKMAEIFGISVEELGGAPPAQERGVVTGNAFLSTDLDLQGSNEKLETEILMLAQQLPSLNNILKKTAISQLHKLTTELKQRWSERDDYWREVRREQAKASERNRILDNKGLPVSSTVADAALKGAAEGAAMVLKDEKESDLSPPTDETSGHKDATGKSTARRKSYRR